MIFDHAFGGTPTSHFVNVLLASIGITGHYKAYNAIREHRIDQHRAWMLRTWCIMACIVTTRPLMAIWGIAVSVLRRLGAPGAHFYATIQLPCEQVFYLLNEGKGVGNTSIVRPDFWTLYGTSCTPNLTNITSPVTPLYSSNVSPVGGFESLAPGSSARLAANLISKRIDGIAAALDLAGGPALLIGLILHALLTELYLRSTPEEAERLRRLGEAKRKAKQRELEKAKQAIPAADDSVAVEDQSASYKVSSTRKGAQGLERGGNCLSTKTLASIDI